MTIRRRGQEEGGGSEALEKVPFLELLTSKLASDFMEQSFLKVQERYHLRGITNPSTKYLKDAQKKP